MKIIMINASPRKTGATAKILKEFEIQLKIYDNIDVSLFHLSDLKIKYCNGCCSCYKTGECFLQDDAEMLSQTIAKADGLIIGSPNYVSGVTGQLKTFIDRGHFVIEQLLKDIYTMSIVTYENADGRSVKKSLKKLFVFSGSKNVGNILIKVPFNENPLKDNRLQKQILMYSRRLHNAIENKAPANIINKVIHTIAFHFGIKPLVLKKGNSYEGVLNHWKKRGILSKNI